jgi:ATP-dependent Clp protease ATP-binding subunit ClpA
VSQQVEKASTEVLTVLLQVLDDGRLTDSQVCNEKASAIWWVSRPDV